MYAEQGTASPHKFFGVIDTDGFNQFLWQEVEGVFDDQKLIFADDFTFARAVPEPAGWLLLAFAAAGLAVVWWLSDKKIR